MLNGKLLTFSLLTTAFVEAAPDADEYYKGVAIKNIPRRGGSWSNRPHETSARGRQWETLEKDGDGKGSKVFPQRLRKHQDSTENVNHHLGIVNESTDDDAYDVVIVGAGWSGVSAAATLESKGIGNYKILEARNHVGGRSHTKTVTWEGVDIAVDWGSSWIHGSKNNPIYDLAVQYDVARPVSRLEAIFYKKNNKGAYTDKNLKYLHKTLYDEGFYPYQQKKQDSTDTDRSLNSVFKKYVSSRLEGNVSMKSILRSFLNTRIEQSSGASIKDLSLWWWDEYGCCGGKEIFMSNGYSSVFKPFLAKKFKGGSDKIETRAVVSKIDYSGSSNNNNVMVSYTNRNGSMKNVRARKVLVTVPLGVLKSNSVRFVPTLPSNHRKSIDSIGMGLLNKVYMFWETADVFWPSKPEWFNEVKRRDGFEFYNPRSLMKGSDDNGAPILIGFVAGRDAVALEEKYGRDDSADEYESAMVRKAMKSLRNMFGKDVPYPKKYMVTKWGSDPFAKGSYSYNKVGMKKNAREILEEPVENKVYFAGEAITDSFASTHGAYFSGENTATEIAKSLGDSDENDYDDYYYYYDDNED